MELEQREIWYEGHVQGVGFRYNTSSIAQRFSVCGFVRNLPDGRVHLVVEGEAAEVKAFLREIGERMEPFIRDTRQDCRPATGQYRRFEIR